MFRRIFVPAAALALCAGPAAAYRPLITEDTRFLGRDVRQVEAGFEHAVSREGRDVYSNTLLGEMSYGLFDGVDLQLSAPWHGWSSHGVSEAGPGDVSMEAKFRAAERGGWTLAVKPGFSLPAGNEARSLGAGAGRAWVYGLAGKSDGDRRYYLNAGFLLNRNSLGERENILRVSAAAARRLAAGLTAAADLAAETNPVKGEATPPLSAVLGLVWSPYGTLDLDAAVRFGLTRPAPDYGLIAGLTLRL